MTSTLSVRHQISILVKVHEIEGGGFWAEVPQFPGCLAQVATLDEIPATVCQAIDDWMSESSEKTEAEAKQLAAIQGTHELPARSYPVPYDYMSPENWTDDDE